MYSIKMNSYIAIAVYLAETVLRPSKHWLPYSVILGKILYHGLLLQLLLY